MRLALPDGAAPHVEWRNVEVQYNEFVFGLRGIKLTIQRGEFVFFCGQTGSGKSTLLKSISREAEVTQGEVLLSGRNVSAVTIGDIPYLRREMGIVPQDFGLLPNKRVWENVGYAMRAVGKTRRQVRNEVPSILEKVNILHRADAFPRELSGGEQQRVAIARALINDPPLLLADEPTGNLDPTHSVEIMTLLQELNAKGTTVIVASHDIATVSKMRARVIELDGGRIAADTPAGEDWVPVTRALEGELEPQNGGMERMSLASLTEEAEAAESDEAVLEQFIEEEEAEDDARPH
jgi:cell division transport system ATP-binding protein